MCVRHYVLKPHVQIETGQLKKISKPNQKQTFGVKCFCLGDIRQVDNPYLNIENNGLNWIVNKFKGHRIYAHIVLKGDKSRGPITDLVINSGL